MENMNEQFEQQQELIKQLKEMVRDKDKEIKSSHNEMEQKLKIREKELKDTASKLSQIKLQSKAKSVSSKLMQKPVDNNATKVEKQPPSAFPVDRSSSGKMLLLKKKLDENRVKFDNREKEILESQKSIQLTVASLKEQLVERDSVIDELRNSKDSSEVEQDQTDSHVTSGAETNMENREMYAQMVYKDTKIVELNNQITELEVKVLDLQENLKEKDEVLQARNKAIQLITENLSKKGKTVVDDLDMTREQMKDMQKKFIAKETEWKNERACLVSALEKLENKTKNDEDEMARYRDKVDSLESIRFDLSTRNAELQEKCVASQVSVQKLNSEFESTILELSSKVDEKNMELEISRNSCNKLTEEFEREISTLKNQNNIQLKELEEKIKEMTKENQNHLDSIQEKMHQADVCDMYKREIANFEAKVSIQKDEMDAQMDVITSLQKNLAEKEGISAKDEENLLHQIKELQQSYENTNAALDALKSEYELKCCEMDGVRNDYDEKIGELNLQLSDSKKFEKEEKEHLNLLLREKDAELEKFNFKVSQLEDECRILSELKVNYETQFSKLESELAEKTRFSDDLKIRLETRICDVDKLERKLRDQSSAVDNLKIQLEEKINDLMIKDSVTSELESEISKQVTQLDEYKAESDRQSSRILSLESRLGSIEEESLVKSNFISELQLEIDSKTSRINEVESDLENIRYEASDLRLMLNNKDLVISDLSQKISATDEELKKGLASFMSDLSDTRSELTNQKSINSEAESKVAELLDENNRLKKNLESVSNENNDASIAVGKLLSEKVILTEQLEGMMSQIKKLSEQTTVISEDRKAEIESLSQENIGLYEKTGELIAAKKELESRVENLTKENARLGENSDYLEKLNVELLNDLDENEKKIWDLKSEFDANSSAEMQSVVSQCSSMKQELHNRELEHIKAMEELEESLIGVKNLEMDLECKESDLSRVQNELVRKTEEIQLLDKQFQELNAEFGKYVEVANSKEEKWALELAEKDLVIQSDDAQISAEVQRLKGEMILAEENATLAEKTMAELKSVTSRLDQELSSEREYNLTLKAEVDARSNEIEELQRCVANYETANETWEVEKRKLFQKCEESEVMLLTLRDNLEVKCSELDELRSAQTESSTVQAKLSEAESFIESLRQSYEIRASEIGRLNEQLESANLKLSDYKMNHEVLEKKFGDDEQCVRQLEKQVLDKVNIITELNDQLESLKVKYVELDKSNDASKISLSSANDKIENLFREYEQVRDECKELKRILQVKTLECEEVFENLKEMENKDKKHIEEIAAAREIDVLHESEVKNLWISNTELEKLRASSVESLERLNEEFDNKCKEIFEKESTIEKLENKVSELETYLHAKSSVDVPSQETNAFENEIVKEESQQVSHLPNDVKMEEELAHKQLLAEYDAERAELRSMIADAEVNLQKFSENEKLLGEKFAEEISSQNEIILRLENEKKDLSRRIEDLSSELSDVNWKLANYECAISESHQVQSELRNKVNELEDERVHNVDKICELELSCSVYSEKLSACEESYNGSIEDAQNLLQKVQLENSELMENLSEAKIIIDRIECEKESLEGSLANENKRAADVSNQLEFSEINLQILTQEFEDCKSNLDSKVEECRNMSSEKDKIISDLENSVKKLESDLNSKSNIADDVTSAEDSVGWQCEELNIEDIRDHVESELSQGAVNSSASKKIETLKKENSTLFNTNERFKAKNDKMLTKLRLFKEKNDKLSAEIKLLKAEKDKCDAMIDEFTKANDLLKQQVNDINQSKNLMTDSVEKQTSKLQSAVKENKALESRIGDLTSEILSFSTLASNLKSELEATKSFCESALETKRSLEEENNKLKPACEELRKAMQQTQALQMEKDNEIKRISLAIESEKISYMELKEILTKEQLQSSAFVDDIQQLKNKIHLLEIEKDQLRKSVEESIENNKHLSNVEIQNQLVVKDLDELKSRLERALVERDTALQRLGSFEANWTEDESNMNIEFEELRLQISHLKESNESLEIKRDVASKTAVKLQDQFEKLQIDNENKICSDSETANVELVRSNDQIRFELGEKDMLLANKDEQIREINSSIRNEREELMSQRNQLESWQMEVSRKFNDVNAMNEQLSAEINKLTVEKKGMAEERTHLMAEIEGLNTNIKDLQTSMNSEREQSDENIKLLTIERLRAELQRAMETIHHKDRICEEMKDSLAQLQEEKYEWISRQQLRPASSSGIETDVHNSSSSLNSSAIIEFDDAEDVVDLTKQSSSVVGTFSDGNNELVKRLKCTERQRLDLHDENTALNNELSSEQRRRYDVEQELRDIRKIMNFGTMSGTPSKSEYHVDVFDQEPLLYPETEYSLCKSISRKCRSHTYKLRRWVRGRQMYFKRHMITRSWLHIGFYAYLMVLHIWFFICIF